MDWFKLYGIEMLADPKYQRLSAPERSCWITLLCLASMDNGVIKHCEEEYLISHSGIDPLSSEWQKCHGILLKLEMLGMITKKRDEKGLEYVVVKNWEKRQSRVMTGYERLKKWRETKRLEAYDNEMITHDNGKRRLDKIREEKRESNDNAAAKPHASLSFLEKIPVEDVQDLSQKYGIAPKGIQSKATDLLLYCQSRNKRYKNYRAFLENALRKDGVKLRQDHPLPRKNPQETVEEPITPEQAARNAKMRESIGLMLKGKKMPQ